MIQFPITCVDNFFKYPEAITTLAEYLEYKPELKGAWPGVRSPELNSVNATIKNTICTKYLRLHFGSSHVGYKALAFFQKVEAGSGCGWVHTDSPNLHTTIIYLNKDETLDSGTSIFRPKKGLGPLVETRHALKKREFNLGKITAEEAEKYRVKSNNDFEETVHFSNVYNRCIGFDSSYWHSANNFVQKDKKEPRLTLIIFWYEVSSGQTGIHRSDMEIL